MSPNKLIFCARLVFLTLSLSLAQCSSESGVSSKVAFDNNPKQPVVIDTDFIIKRDDGDGDPSTFESETIAGPWFLFGYTVKNNSSKTITVVNFKLLITGKKGGLDVEYEKELDLKNLGDNVTFLEEIAPGSSASNYINYRWYIGGLPKIDNFSYSVKVTVQGWVGKSTEPEERLTGSWSFTTE
jgi:hypothetical protein